MSTKEQLREQARFHRDRIRPEEEDVERAGVHIAQILSSLPPGIIAAYWPAGKEFDPRFIIHDLLKEGRKLCLPVASKGDHVMRFSLWDGAQDLVAGEFGIMVPPVMNEVAPDIVIAPLLAFDRRGYRLGRGGGHYDATLADLRSRRRITAIGLGYAAQAVLFNLPVEEHDQKMDVIVTPAAVHDFRQ